MLSLNLIQPNFLSSNWNISYYRHLFRSIFAFATSVHKSWRINRAKSKQMIILQAFGAIHVVKAFKTFF